MKSIISYLIISSMLVLGVQNSSAQKKNKKERQMEQFAETQKLIDQKEFIFVPDRAFPQGGRSIDLTTNYGFIKIMGEETEADMPFFGRGYSGIGYGGSDSGIKYEKTSIENEKVEINEKKKKVIYSFEAKSKNDTFRITMDISYSGSTSVSVISNNRSSISYNGTTSIIEKEEEKEKKEKKKKNK